MDPDTFLVTLYCSVDDFCKTKLDAEPTRPGPKASLSRSEILTLALFGQWTRFKSERDFYRHAHKHLRDMFPRLPDYSQFNRLMRHYWMDTAAFLMYLVECMQAKNCCYEILDAFGAVTRNIKRHGSGWMDGIADKGWCGRMDGYKGFYILDAVTAEGVVTGYGFGPASAKEQPLAETFLFLRAFPDPMIPTIGEPAWGVYIADNGFEGKERQENWLSSYGARVISPRKSDCKDAWPRYLWRWLGSIRQIVESVHDKILNTFRLSRERPHDLVGFQARLAAKMALHNFCVWLNKQRGRPPLAFAELIEW